MDDQATMEPVPFGRRLVESGDLDPVYLMLTGYRRARSDGPEAVERFCLAYWMFYHVGVAARIAQAGRWDFWDVVQEAQDSKWPRGTERRHFRGRQAQAAITALRTQYPDPHDAIAYLAAPDPVAGAPALRFTTVYERAKAWRGFGPWVSFKIADMLDGVLGAAVDFSDSVPFFYGEPVAGAHLMLGVTYGSEDPAAVTTRAVEALRAAMWDMAAPHASHRSLGVQEYETVLCKWKAHRNGHYPVGKDTREVREALTRWGTMTKGLMEFLPPCPEEVRDEPQGA